MQARAVQNAIARFSWELDNLERHVAVDTFPLHKMPNPSFCRPQSENNCWNQGTSAAKARFTFLLLKNLVCAGFIDGLIFFQSGPPQLRHRPSLLSTHFHQTGDYQGWPGHHPLPARIAPTGRYVHGQLQDAKRQQTPPGRHVTAPRWSRHSRPDKDTPILGSLFAAQSLSSILNA